MKRVLMVVLALAMGLTMVLGSVSTISAARPVSVDNGYARLNILGLTSTNANGTWNWNVDTMHNFIGTDNTHLNAIGRWERDFSDTVVWTINWRKGIATFTNQEVNLTVKMADLSGIFSSGTSRDAFYYIQYGGSGTITGTITIDTVVYNVNTTNQNIDIRELHDFSPRFSAGNLGWAANSSGGYDISYVVSWNNSAVSNYKVEWSYEGAVVYSSTTNVNSTTSYISPTLTQSVANGGLWCVTVTFSNSKGTIEGGTAFGSTYIGEAD